MLPDPTDLGFNSKFSSWRKGQPDAIEAAINSDKRHFMLVAPTGSGKSVSSLAVAKLRNVRTLYLTSTKGLQNQLQSDFGEFAVDVRGKSSYRCCVDPAQWTCEDGPCNFGYDCDQRDYGCTYYAAMRRAKNAQVVITNYALWMSLTGREDEPLGKFRFLIMDEAHDAPDWVCNYLSVEIDKRVLRDLSPDLAARGLPKGNVYEWQRWAASIREEVEEQIREVKEEIKATHSSHAVREGQRLLSLQRKLLAVMRAKEDWVTEYDEEKGIGRVDPVWPKEYSEPVIFRQIPNIYMTSATANRKTAEMMGVSADIDVKEQDSEFPIANRLVTFVPSVRVDHRMTKEEEKVWLSRIEQIVRTRLDRKGVIHTVSYKRRDAIVEMLKQKIPSLNVITHTSYTTGKEVSRFKAAGPGTVLVSPSVSTGFDFPMSECRYQIISKVAFPDARSTVMRARTKQDNEYAYYIAIQDLIQSCGRSTRAADDWSEVFVTDDHFSWFWNKYKKFSPKWFQQAVRFSRTIPPPIKLREEEK